MRNFFYSLLLLCLLLTGCSSSSENSKAKAYSKQVSANLDTTTVEQFMDQMPSGMQPKIERSGENRNFTFTFDDGSKIIATFRAKGGEGSQQGLVLYTVDIT